MLGKPNAKCDHIWVVVRLDRYRETGLDEGCITLTRAFWSEEAALAQVERLCQRWPDEESHYFLQRARLERQVQS